VTESEIARDKRAVLEYLRSSRKFMPYLHESMPASGAVSLLGSRDRAQRALVALVQDRKITYLENCSPDHYQSHAEPVKTPAAAGRGLVADFTFDGERLADHAVRIHPTDVSPVPAIPSALRGLTAFSRAEGERPTRQQLRAWVKTMLADYARRGLEIVELRGELAGDRPTRAEFDRLRENYSQQEREIAHVIRERDEARSRHARTQADYLLLRLSGDRPEVVPVSSWEETSDGGVSVEGVASSDLDVRR
jgi:hypothetical protein